MNRLLGPDGVKYDEVADGVAYSLEPLEAFPAVFTENPDAETMSTGYYFKIGPRLSDDSTRSVEDKEHLKLKRHTVGSALLIESLKCKFSFRFQNRIG